MDKITQKLAIALLLPFSLSAHAETPPGWVIHSPTSQSYRAEVLASHPVEGEKYAVLSSDAADRGEFGTLMQAASANDLRGKRVRLSAQIKSEQADLAWLWLRADREDGRAVAFDNMMDRAVIGTNDWSYQSIVLDLPDTTEAVAFGVGLKGTGKVFVDAFVIETVSHEVPVTKESRIGPPKSPMKPNLVKPKPENLGFEGNNDSAAAQQLIAADPASLGG